MKFLIISFIFMFVVFLVSCAQEKIKDPEFSNLQEPVIIMNSTKKFGRASEYNKALDRTVKLPLKIWPSYTQKMITLGGNPTKDTCVLEGEPKAKAEMTDVEILEEASCLYTLFQEEGRAPGQYFVGIKKVRIIDTGEIGWTWSNAIAE